MTATNSFNSSSRTTAVGSSMQSKHATVSENVRDDDQTTVDKGQSSQQKRNKSMTNQPPRSSTLSYKQQPMTQRSTNSFGPHNKMTKPTKVSEVCQVSTVDSQKNQMLLQSSAAAATVKNDQNTPFEGRSSNRVDDVVTTFSHYGSKPPTSSGNMLTTSH